MGIRDVLLCSVQETELNPIDPGEPLKALQQEGMKQSHLPTKGMQTADFGDNSVTEMKTI